MNTGDKHHIGSEKELVSRVCKGDEKAFEQLFFEYYYPLCGFAAKITKSQNLARDAVQEVFYKIWRSGEAWEIEYSLKVYLYQAVRNQSLNLIARQKSQHRLKEQLEEETIYSGQNSFPGGTVSYSEKLITKIWELVGQMPPRRKLVFELHRKHGLSYKEISRVMGISLKTVENHMGHALQFIRDQIDIRQYW